MTIERVERIRKKLQDAFEPESLDVEDDSHKHAGHEGAKGGLGHFNVMIVSAHFNGMKPLARHREITIPGNSPDTRAHGGTVCSVAAIGNRSAQVAISSRGDGRRSVLLLCHLATGSSAKAMDRISILVAQKPARRVQRVFAASSSSYCAAHTSRGQIGIGNVIKGSRGPWQTRCLRVARPTSPPTRVPLAQQPGFQHIPCGNVASLHQ